MPRVSNVICYALYERPFHNDIQRGTYASFVLWLIGLWGKANNYERLFQANSNKRKTVISVIFLAKEMIRKKGVSIPIHAIKNTFHQIPIILMENQYVSN